MRGWRRWFVTLPAIVGIVLCLVGALLAPPSGDDFLPYVAVVVGGWALAFAAVNALAGIGTRAAWTAHVLLALAAIVGVSGMTALLEAMQTVPASWARPLGFALLAVPPACGWVLVTFLGRISSQLTLTAARRAEAIPDPVWSGSDSRPELTVTAARMTRAQLTGLIVAVVVIGGAAVTLIMIAAERWVTRFGPLALTVMLGLVIGLPLYGLVHTIVNRRRVPVTIRWHTGALEIDAGAPWMVPLSTITRLVWCERGDMARVEVQTPTRSEVYVVGMVRQAAQTSAQLPPLQRRTLRALEDAGLVHSERRGAVRFSRGSAIISLVDAAQPDRG